jgi:hypothetical protein
MEFLELAQIDGRLDAVLSSYGRVPTMAALAANLQRAGQLVAIAVIAVVFITQALWLVVGSHVAAQLR